MSHIAKLAVVLTALLLPTAISSLQCYRGFPFTTHCDGNCMSVTCSNGLKMTGCAGGSPNNAAFIHGLENECRYQKADIKYCNCDRCNGDDAFTCETSDTGGGGAGGGSGGGNREGGNKEGGGSGTHGGRSDTGNNGGRGPVSCYKAWEANACTGDFCFTVECAGIPVNGCGAGPKSMAEGKMREICGLVLGYTEGSLKICESDNCNVPATILDKIKSYLPWY